MKMHFECLLYLQSFKSEVVKIREVALPFLQLSQTLKTMLFRINLPAILIPNREKRTKQDKIVQKPYPNYTQNQMIG